MKSLNSTGVLVALFCSLLLPTFNYAQTVADPLPPGYYIVVAAYRLHQSSYAESYINRISKEGMSAKYGADLGRKYIYVYLDYYSDFDESIKEMLATRKKAGFEKAWVRIMKDELPGEKVDLLTEEKPSNSAEEVATPTQESEVVADNSNGEQKNIDVSEAAENVVEEEAKEVEVAAASIEDNPITEPVDLSEASVYLSLFNATNNKQIEGEVEVVDTDRARLIEKVKGNEYIQLPDPKSKSGKLTLLANVFGYRPLQYEIDYLHVQQDTLENFIEWAGNHYLVKFDMVRYHKGDIHTLYNVYFYNDAAIMLPESKYQLNNLLDMMKENEKYRIKLHGHTNGKARGTILTMGPSQSFFSLEEDIKKSTGSAKELSYQRALVIKDWLISQGIAESRIEVKAWGGGRMLHDQHSVNAKKNVRVDVEILSE